MACVRTAECCEGIGSRFNSCLPGHQFALMMDTYCWPTTGSLPQCRSSTSYKDKE